MSLRDCLLSVVWGSALLGLIMTALVFLGAFPGSLVDRLASLHPASIIVLGVALL